MTVFCGLCSSTGKGWANVDKKTTKEIIKKTRGAADNVSPSPPTINSRLRPGAGRFSATPSRIRPLVVGLKRSACGIFNRLQYKFSPAKYDPEKMAYYLPAKVEMFRIIPNLK